MSTESGRECEYATINLKSDFCSLKSFKITLIKEYLGANFAKHLRICGQRRNFRAKFAAMLRYPALLLILALISCESPEDKISRLQSETLALLGSGDFFVFNTQSRTIMLALPPSLENAAQCAQRIPRISQEINVIDAASLSATDQERLERLKTIVETLANKGADSAFDPNKCVIADLLADDLRGETGKVVLEKIPEYYAEVERRWQQPNSFRALQAAQQSLRSLDMLQEMGSDADRARLAVKDFIGMCQSAACLCE